MMFFNVELCRDLSSLKIWIATFDKSVYSNKNKKVG